MDEELTFEQIVDKTPALWRNKLRPAHCVYLYYLEKFKMDKLKAYLAAYPKTNEENARKNHMKVNRKVRAAAPEVYEEVIDRVNGRAKTVEEKQYIMGLAYNHGNKTKAIAVARPDLGRDGRKSATKRIERSLTAKDPNWRVKLTEDYDPAKYFSNLNDLAQGMAKGGEICPAAVQRQSNIDMLEMMNFTKAGGGLDADRAGRKSQWSDQIEKLLNLKVESGGTVNIQINSEDEA